MGGTFMSLPADYRDYFVRNLHDALSGHTSANVAEAVSEQVACGVSPWIRFDVLTTLSPSLHRRNETVSLWGKHPLCKRCTSSVLAIARVCAEL
jgi:hypothetical protein